MELIESGQNPEGVLGNLEKILKKKGHERFRHAILSGVLRRLEANSKTQVATVTLADKKDVDTQKKTIKQILSTLDLADEYTLKTDSSIVGGVLVETRDRRVDATYKSALLKLYRNITN